MSKEAMKLALEALEEPKEHIAKHRRLEAIIALKQALEQPEPEPVAWLITDEKINSIQVDSIQRLIDRAKHAHMTDIKLRINGQDEWYQADWLKHMTRTSPTKPEPVAWAISFDGETPYTLWDGGDCALLDIEVNRHGGKTRKMPLYTAPPKREPEPVIDKSAAIRIATSLGWTPKREPLTDEEIETYRYMIDWTAGWSYIEFARAIEAAHGIRGKHD